MNYSKEILWHFTCKFCKGWWSMSATDGWEAPGLAVKNLYCPHCGTDQKIDEDIGYTGIM